jgi:NADPH-dependent curcumin reductase CurA
MLAVNRCVVLAARPNGIPKEEDFRLEERAVPELRRGQILCRNLVLSIDPGLRNWMNAGSGDNVLPAMLLDEPVMGLSLSRVLRSMNSAYRAGDLLMARFAWEEYTVTDAEDFISPLHSENAQPLSYYLGVLGNPGLSAYFGLSEYSDVKVGETVVVSSAAGAVGSIAGQIANYLGARTVGISSSRDKCQRLVSDLGYNATINRHSANQDSEFLEACPGGIDVYFDNVGGPLLELALDHINEDARILLCGATSEYNNTEPLPGPRNLFQLTTKHAHVHGLMTHLQLDRYAAARDTLSGWIDDGHLVVYEQRLSGIEKVGKAFCDLFTGSNFGNTVVEL